MSSNRQKKMNLRPSSCANGLTYTIFTILPVIMFSTILVLKLRSNYLEQMDHLHSSMKHLGLQANHCAEQQDMRQKKLQLMRLYQEKCKDTLGKASLTLASLNAAFRVQWDRSDKAVADMNRTQYHYNSIQQVMDHKDNLTKSLLRENARLKSRLDELDQRLHNVTSTKNDLEGQLGKVKIDFDGLKSNTSRLEGEKEGLEKVLEVKKDADEDEEEEEEGRKVRRTKKKRKHKAKKGNGGKEPKEEEEEEEEEDEEAKKVLDQKKKEKESIEKIVKEHIEKLGLASNGSGSAAVKAASKGSRGPPSSNQEFIARGAASPVGLVAPLNNVQKAIVGALAGAPSGAAPASVGVLGQHLPGVGEAKAGGLDDQRPKQPQPQPQQLAVINPLTLQKVLTLSEAAAAAAATAANGTKVAPKGQKL